MLLLRSDLTWKELTTKYLFALVALPASVAGVDGAERKKRANHLAVVGRSANYWVTVLQNSTGEVFVCFMGHEAQVIGRARKLVREGETAEPWFLFRHNVGDTLCWESVDGVQKFATLTDTGFVLPDGRTFEPDKLYHPAQNNTGLMHHLGRPMGDHVCTEEHCAG